MSLSPRPAPRLWIGTSGWSYADWNGVVYPASRPRSFKPLVFLSRFLNAAEVNTSFYRIPTPRMTAAWPAQTPSHFRFAFKLTRNFTHDRAELPDPSTFLAFADALRPVRDAGKLGPLLVQFPWSFRFNPANADWLARLADRLRESGCISDTDADRPDVNRVLANQQRLNLTNGQRQVHANPPAPDDEHAIAHQPRPDHERANTHQPKLHHEAGRSNSSLDIPTDNSLPARRFTESCVIEVRHSSWLCDDGRAAIARAGVWCNIDQPTLRDCIGPTAFSSARLAYVRLHGRNAPMWFAENVPPFERYNYLYDEHELREWVERLNRILRDLDSHAGGNRDSDGGDAYVFTNNHYRGQAVANALELRALLEKKPIPAPDPLRAAYPRLAHLTRGDSVPGLFDC